MRIYLVGFMGSGKSTLGKKASSHFKVPFIDTDVEVEYNSRSSIQEIFETQGEEGFRLMENDVLIKTITSEKAIIATGGGLPCFYDHMEWINKHGISIYLDWPLDIIKNNILSERSTRPLISSLNDVEAEKKIEELFTARRFYYEQAAISISMTGELEKDEAALIKACRYIW